MTTSQCVASLNFKIKHWHDVTNRGTKYKKSDTLGKHMFKLIKNVAPASTLIKQNDA